VPDWNLGATLAERSENVARLKADVVDQLT
jgi:hypothetical protein